MGSSDSIIKDFLKSPLDSRKFLVFYNLIYRHTLGYVNYLERHGRTMPSETGDRESRLTDLTIDILGAFLRCDKSRPYHIVFDHFEKCGLTDADRATSDELQECLCGLLNGHARQEISKLRGQEDPQISNLKRRFKDILNGSEYVNFGRGTDRIECVHHVESADDLRIDKMPVTGACLEALVDIAYKSSNSRAEWCRNLFEKLNDEKKYQNFIVKHELLSTIVAINCRELEPYDGIAKKVTGPRDGMLRRLMDSASEHAAERTEQEIVTKFREKGKITEHESAALMAALNAYLSDLCEHGDTDPVPRYFKENMPQEAHARYLNEYKYVFETIVNKSVEYFREFLRKNGTSVGFGDY